MPAFARDPGDPSVAVEGTLHCRLLPPWRSSAHLADRGERHAESATVAKAVVVDAHILGMKKAAGTKNRVSGARCFSAAADGARSGGDTLRKLALVGPWAAAQELLTEAEPSRTGCGADRGAARVTRQTTIDSVDAASHRGIGWT